MTPWARQDVTVPDVPLGWSASDDDSVVRFELSDHAPRRPPRGSRPAGSGRRRFAWLLAVCAAAALVITGVLGFTGGDADEPELAAQDADPSASVAAPETLPPPVAIDCTDSTALAEVAELMPYDGGMDVGYRIAPDLARLVGRSRVVAAATIESMEVDGRFTVLQLSRVHILTGTLPRTLARVAAPGRWTQERERVRFDGLRAVLFVHAAELVDGAEWIPDVQGIVIGCDDVEGTEAILEPLPSDADTSSIDALTRDVLTLGRNL